MNASKIRCKRLTGMVALVLAMSAGPSAAQVATSFEDLRTKLAAGAPLAIADDAGRVTKGRLVTIAGDSITIVDRGSRTLVVPRASIASITSPRSRARKGASIGLAGGAAAGALLGALALAEDSSCTGPCFGIRFGAAEFLGGTLILGGLGAGAGALIGKLMPAQKVVYERSPAPATVAVSPVLGADRQGVRVAWRW